MNNVIIFYNKKSGREKSKWLSRLGLSLSLILSLFIFSAYTQPKGSSNHQHNEVLPMQDAVLNDIVQRIPPLQFQVLQPQVWRAGNSVVYFMQDRDLPLVRIQLIVHRGTFHDLKGKEGLAETFGQVWRQSGSEKFSGDDLNQFFEFIGGSLEVKFDRSYGKITLSVLKKDLPESWERMRSFIEAPAFLAEKLDLVKGLKMDQLKREMDEPFSLAFRYFRGLAFAGYHYGKNETLASLKGITLTDLHEFYKQSFHQGNISWLISGDLGKEEVDSFIQSMNFRKNGIPALSLKENSADIHQAVKQKAKQVYLVVKDLPQSTILIGTSTMKYSDEKHFSLYLANYILGGGGFNSRLTQEVRSNRGLAYSVGSITRFYRDFGLFVAYAQTKNVSVSEVIQIMQKEMTNMSSQPVAPATLKWAQDAIINKFVFSFTNADAIVSRRFQMDWNGLAGDYLNQYTERISKIKVEDIQKSSGNYLKPEEMIILVVGPRTLAQSLSSFGSVKVIEPQF